MFADKGTLLELTGGVRLKQRVQHPKVHERKDRGSYYWFFRYRHDELLPDGSIKTTRRFHTIGPSRGENGIPKKLQALIVPGKHGSDGLFDAR